MVGLLEVWWVAWGRSGYAAEGQPLLSSVPLHAALCPPSVRHALCAWAGYYDYRKFFFCDVNFSLSFLGPKYLKIIVEETRHHRIEF